MFRIFLAITVAELPPDTPVVPVVAPAEVVVVVDCDDDDVVPVVVDVGFSPLTIRKTRALRRGDPSTDPEVVVVVVAAAETGASFALVILATNRCRTAVVGAVGSAFRLCLLLLQKGYHWWFAVVFVCWLRSPMGVINRAGDFLAGDSGGATHNIHSRQHHNLLHINQHIRTGG